MLLGIDLGTGSAKALLLSLEGTVVAEAASGYAVHAPQPGWAESHPEDWWRAVTIAVRSAVQDQSDRIQAIGLSGQMHGVVLTHANGDPLRPALLWADTRSSQMLSAYRALNPQMQQRLANPIVTGMAGASLLWLRSQQPDAYAAARWALQPKDWLRLRLTGTVATEPADASGTLLYDVLADDWAFEIVEALQLRSDWLPPLIPSSHIAGQLVPAAAAALGLPIGLPVVAGAGDTAAALLGSGLLEPGGVQLTIGTAAQIATIRSQPILDPHGRTHLYRTALPHQWYTLAAMQNAGLALEWVRSILGYGWTQIYAEAFAVAPGCEGLTFLPYLTGERSPHLDPHIRGAWVGLGLHHTRAHLMRSALEGVAFALRQGLEAIVATGIDVSHLRLAGGGTIAAVWRQLLADVLQVPLHSVSVTSASARGAAILAGMGLRTATDALLRPIDSSKITVPLSNNLSNNLQLEAAWQRFCSLYPALHQVKPSID